MEPIKIRAYLRCGVIADKFLPLDGILLYHKMRAKYGYQDITQPSVVLSELVDLPLAKRNESRKDWYYACSFAQWANVIAEGEDAYSKRFDLANAANFIDFKNKVGKVDTTRGEYKNYRNILFYWHALYIDWYAVGVKEEVEKILRFCTHIGKKAAQGWGEVIRWEVESWYADWSEHREGKLMRALPYEEGSFIYGIRPPYWLPEHQFAVML